MAGPIARVGLTMASSKVAGLAVAPGPQAFVTITPPMHLATTVMDPGTIVPVKSASAGRRIVWSEISVTSNPLSDSDPLMKMAILIWVGTGDVTGPVSVIGAAGQSTSVVWAIQIFPGVWACALGIILFRGITAPRRITDTNRSARILLFNSI